MGCFIGFISSIWTSGLGIKSNRQSREVNSKENNDVAFGTFTGFVDSNTNPQINLCLLASAPLRQSLVVLHAAEPSSIKKADVIDLTLESSSSDDDDDDEEDTDHPLKKRCVYISKNEEIHAKGWENLYFF